MQGVLDGLWAKYALSVASLHLSVPANSSQSQGSTGWLTDTSASDHFTPNLSTLLQQPTYGTKTVTLGNGFELPITHVGNAAMVSFILISFSWKTYLAYLI